MYATRQTKLWKVLSKYDRLPDHFHDLQTALQTEFSLLKKATSKNIENLQDAIYLQQTYTMSLCSHVNSIYTKLAQCYIVGLDLDCKFIDLLIKRSINIFIKISLYLNFIVLEIISKQTDTLI